MTLLEKSGNDFDQCTLLVSLLREAAASNSAIGNVTYKYGMMTIPGTAADQRDFTRWLGFGDWLSIGTETVNGGWPYLSGADRSIFYNNDYVALARVCVEAVIGGTARLLDPSFKKHTDIAGIDIKSASGYVQSTLLTQAGGTSTAAQVSGMNPVNPELISARSRTLSQIR